MTVDNAATKDDVDSANTLGIIGIVVGVLGRLVVPGKQRGFSSTPRFRRRDGRVSRKIEILRTGGTNREGRAVAPAKAAGAPILFLPLSGSGSHRRHRRTPPATVAAAPALLSFP